jgi:cysteine desulfurase
VLAAMGLPADLARGAIRFTLGPATTDEDIARALAAVPAAVAALRRRP